MALQFGLKRSLFSNQIAPKVSVFNGITDATARRWKSTDMGDVIGIDLGTTNSCVAIMVGRIVNLLGALALYFGCVTIAHFFLFVCLFENHPFLCPLDPYLFVVGRTQCSCYRKLGRSPHYSFRSSLYRRW